jgi:hypothetical protein
MLYKYGSGDRVRVLTSGQIRFTPANALNDPFELKPYFEELVTEGELLAHWEENPLDMTPHLLEAYEKAPQLHHLITREKWLEMARASLESDEGQDSLGEMWQMAMGLLRGVARDLRSQMHNMLRAGVGILSLSETPTHPLMWAHYADEHRGMLLSLDDQHRFFDRRRGPNDEFYHLRQVVYRLPQPRASLSGLESADVFLVKRPEWSYEREWRMLAPLQAADLVLGSAPNEIHLFNIPPAAISGVILGARSSDVLKDSVRALQRDVRYRHLRIQRAVLDDRSQQIEIVDP